MKHLVIMFIRQVYGFCLALDLLASSVTGGAPLETLSARFWKNRQKVGWGQMQVGTDWVVLTIFGVPNHCQGAWEAYLAREAAAPTYSG